MSTLQTSKRRITEGKWSYRNYTIVKDNSDWKISNVIGEDEKSQKIKEIEPDSSIKTICLKIDEILGELPNSKKKKEKRKKKYTEQEINQFIAKARRAAYEVREFLEIELEKTNTNDELKGRLAIPLNQGKVVNKNTFVLTFPRKFDIMDSVLNSIKDKNPEIIYDFVEKENKTELKVKIINELE
jgi:hypothetical protein